MVVRTPGRRSWEVHWMHFASSAIASILVLSSFWFLHGSILRARKPHSPHFSTVHCFDCHRGGANDEKVTCFDCHDSLTRVVRPGVAKPPDGLDCAHSLRGDDILHSRRAVTALCISCHKTITGYVKMVDISTGKYVEVDMARTHPIGLMPTETIHPRTLPLSRETGAINCITCHDPHAADERLHMLRYYYPGNGHPADFRPLCLDCHPSGWLPLKLRPKAVEEAVRRD